MADLIPAAQQRGDVGFFFAIKPLGGHWNGKSRCPSGEAADDGTYGANSVGVLLPVIGHPGLSDYFHLLYKFGEVRDRFFRQVRQSLR